MLRTRTGVEAALEWQKQQKKTGHDIKTDCQEILRSIQPVNREVKTSGGYELVFNIPISSFDNYGHMWRDLVGSEENIYNRNGVAAWNLLCALSALIHRRIPPPPTPAASGATGAALDELAREADGQVGELADNALFVERLTDTCDNTTGYRVWASFDVRCDDLHETLIKMLWPPPPKKKKQEKTKEAAAYKKPMEWEKYTRFTGYEDFYLNVLGPVAKLRYNSSYSDVSGVERHRLGNVLSIERAMKYVPDGTRPEQTRKNAYTEGHDRLRRFPVANTALRVSTKYFSPPKLWMAVLPHVLRQSVLVYAKKNNLKTRLPRTDGESDGISEDEDEDEEDAEDEDEDEAPEPSEVVKPWLSDGLMNEERTQLHRLMTDIARGFVTQHNYEEHMNRLSADVGGAPRRILSEKFFAIALRYRNQVRQDDLKEEYGNIDAVPHDVMDEYRLMAAHEFYRAFMRCNNFPHKMKDTRKKWDQRVASKTWRPNTYPTFFNNLTAFGSMIARWTMAVDRLLMINNNHGIVMRMIGSARGAARYNEDGTVNPHLMVYGSGGAGKSYGLKAAAKLCFDGSYEEVGHSTALSATGDDNYDVCSMSHETPASFLGTDGKGNALASDQALAFRKLRLTEAWTRIQETVLRGRNARPGEPPRTMARSVRLFNGTNIDLFNDVVNLECAMATRYAKISIPLDRLAEARKKRDPHHVVLDVNYQPDTIKNSKTTAEMCDYIKTNHWISYIVEKAIQACVIPDVDMTVAINLISRVIGYASSKASGVNYGGDRNGGLYLAMCRSYVIAYAVEVVFFASELTIIKGTEDYFDPAWILEVSKHLVCTKEIAVYVASLFEEMWIPVTFDRIFELIEVETGYKNPAEKDPSKALGYRDKHTRMLTKDSVVSSGKFDAATAPMDHVAFVWVGEDAEGNRVEKALSQQEARACCSDPTWFDSTVRTLSFKDPDYLEVECKSRTNAIKSWCAHASEETKISANVVETILRDLARTTVSVKAREFVVYPRTSTITLRETTKETPIPRVILNYGSSGTGYARIGVAVGMMGEKYQNLMEEAIMAVVAADAKDIHYITGWPHTVQLADGRKEQSLCKVMKLRAKKRDYITENPKALTEGHAICFGGLDSKGEFRTSVHHDSVISGVWEDMNDDDAAIAAYWAKNNIYGTEHPTPKNLKNRMDRWWAEGTKEKPARPAELLECRAKMMSYPISIVKDLQERAHIVREMSLKVSEDGAIAGESTFKVVARSQIIKGPAAAPMDVDTPPEGAARERPLERTTVKVVGDRYKIHDSIRAAIMEARAKPPADGPAQPPVPPPFSPVKEEPRLDKLCQADVPIQSRKKKDEHEKNRPAAPLTGVKRPFQPSSESITQQAKRLKASQDRYVK